MHENYDLDLLLELVEQRKFRSIIAQPANH